MTQPIHPSETTEIKQAIDYAINNLGNAKNVRDLPRTLKDKVKVLQAEFKDYADMLQNTPPRLLTGHTLTEEEAKQVVIDGSGYTRWKSYVNEDFDVQDFLDHFGITVKDPETEVVQYVVERSTSDRSAVYLVEVTCVPGFAQLFFVTDRADGGAGILFPNEQLKDEIDREFV